MPDENESENNLLWPLEGLAYFITSPRHWKGPVLAMAAALVVMAGLFFWIVFANWPESHIGWIKYLWTIVKSFGYGFAAVLTVWVIALPLGLVWCFEGMQRRIFKEEGVEVVGESLLHSLRSGLYVFFHTLGWRIFWPLLALICTFTLGPVGILVGHIGLGHVSAIDSCDLSLSLLGYRGAERLQEFKRRRGSIFLSGVIGGSVGFLLGLTVIAWLFWLPGVFAGGPLWVKNWAVRKKKPEV